MQMTPARVAAVAASAYNVCGPQTGEPARPSTVLQMDRSTVAACMEKYRSVVDDLYTPAETFAAIEALSALN